MSLVTPVTLPMCRVKMSASSNRDLYQTHRAHVCTLLIHGSLEVHPKMKIWSLSTPSETGGAQECVGIPQGTIYTNVAHRAQGNYVQLLKAKKEHVRAVFFS